MSETQNWPEAESAAFYRDAMALLQENGVPFLLGGAYALCVYTGIVRRTKDLDLFLRRDDAERALSLFSAMNYRVERSFPHWLAKIFCGDFFADLIYAAGNGLAEVDDSWFACARDDELLGLKVKVMAPEEMIWMKAFIQERERFDGADVAHLLLACGPTMDWPHLCDRFGEDWRVLLSHLVLFGYIYPSERNCIPDEVIAKQLARLHEQPKEGERKRICRGTLLSRAQYLPDVEERGFEDARLHPRTAMDRKDVAHWTAAIDPEHRAEVSEGCG